MSFHGILRFKPKSDRKQLRFLRTFSIAILFVTIAFGDSQGLSFLTTPSPAPVAATMNALAPISDSPVALFVNPTGIQTDVTLLNFAHNLWFADVRTDVLSVAFPVRGQSLSAGLLYTRIPGIEVRDIPSDDPLGTVEAQYWAAALGYAYRLNSRLRIAGSLKYLHEKLYTENAHGAALDIAAVWSGPRDIAFSAMLQNAGGMNALLEEQTTLPTLAQLGVLHPALYEDQNLQIRSGLSVGSYLSNGKMLVQAGAELRIRELLSLRGGLEFSEKVAKAAFGAGLRFPPFRIDYAILFMPEGLGYPQLLSLTFQPR